MKKTFLSLLIIGSSLAVCAQDVRSDSSNNNSSNNNTSNSYNTSTNSYNTSTNSYNNNQMNNNSMSSNNSYNAYSNVPTNVRYSFQRDYPSASNVMWSQNNEWYHVSYLNNGQAMNTYYNMAGQTFNVALPVMETQIPADVVSRVSSTYGANVYDITRTKGENNQDVYLVRILDNNGQIRTERINGDGTAVTEGSMNSSNSMSNTNSTDNGTTTNSTTNSGTTTTDTTSTNSSTSDMNTTTTDNTSSSSTDTNTGAKQKDKMKIKTVTPDGKKEILKAKNGKVKTRKSDKTYQNY